MRFSKGGPVAFRRATAKEEFRIEIEWLLHSKRVVTDGDCVEESASKRYHPLVSFPVHKLREAKKNTKFPERSQLALWLSAHGHFAEVRLTASGQPE
jgi:hypothetical protein